VVLGLSGSGLFGNESATTVENFRDQTGVTFPLLLGDSTYGSYAQPDGSISPYPLDVVVDKNGIIRYVGHHFDGAAIESTIQKLLAE
jgi:hypothetical protein